MLVIRQAQLEAFQREMDERFVRQLVDHLRAGYPRETAPLKPSALEAHVRAALDEAHGYGLVSQRDLCRFLNLTMAGGLGWSASPRMSWAHGLLQDESLGWPADRLHKVHCQSAFRL